MASATKEKKTAKRGRKKTSEKRKLVDQIINEEPKKRGRKPKADPDIRPINRGVKKVNLGHRAALARRLGISTQTLYNREAAFDKCLPEYFSGLSYLPRRGGALKVIPDLTPYQQFCHFQLEALREGLRQSLGVKECTPTEMVIKNNLDHFNIDLFNRQQQLTVDVEVESSSIEKV